MNNQQKSLALIMLGITGAAYGTDIMFNNNSDHTVEVLTYTHVSNIGVTLSASSILAPQTSATISLNIPDTFSIGIRALVATSKRQRIDPKITSHSIRFAGATFDPNKTTYNISIVNNKVVVS